MGIPTNEQKNEKLPRKNTELTSTTETTELLC